MWPNFKFKVLGASRLWQNDIIIGKIYEVKNGFFYDEAGYIWGTAYDGPTFKKNIENKTRLYWLEIEIID